MTLLAAVMVSTAAVAQDKDSNKPSEDNNRKQEMVKHRTDKMVEDYQLNDKQAKKLLELHSICRQDAPTTSWSPRASWHAWTTT